MSKRPSLDQERVKIPGPGEYQDASTVISKRNPKYAFGSGSRDDPNLRKQKPGPGDYEVPQAIGNDCPAKYIH